MPDANYTKIAWPKISHDDAASSAITAGLPPGDAWRSAKAKLQRRDRRGRFAEMGGGFSFKFRLKNGDVARASGKIVGMSGQEDVDVEVAGSSSLPDGVYSVPASKGDAVKAVIGKSALEDVRRENVDVADDDAVIENIDSLRRTVAEDAEKPKKSYAPPPEETERSNSNETSDKQFVDVRVSFEEFIDVVDASARALIEKYVPEEQRNAPMATIIETIMRGMKVDNSYGFNINGNKEPKSIAEQIDEQASTLHDIYGKLARGEELPRWLDDSSLKASYEQVKLYYAVVEARERNRARGKESLAANEIIEVISTVIDATPGSPQRQALENDIAAGIINALAALEELLESNPHLRGSIAFSTVHPAGTSSNSIAHAGLSTDDSGRLVVSVQHTYSALSDLYGSSSATYSKHRGGLNPWVVDLLMPSRSGTAGRLTSTHENTHARHHIAVAKRFGVDFGSEAEPILNQLAKYGTLQSTVLGALVSLKEQLENPTSQELLNEKLKVSRNAAVVLTISRAVTGSAAPNLDVDPRVIADYLFSDFGMAGAAIGEAIGLRDREIPISLQYRFAGEELSTPEATREFVERYLGMPAEQYVRLLADSLSADLGMPIGAISTNGISEEDIFEALEGVSGYGNTKFEEAIAESGALISLLDSLENVNLMGNEDKIQKVRDMMTRIFDGDDAPTAGLKRTSERTTQLLERYNRLVEALSELEWDFA